MTHGKLALVSSREQDAGLDAAQPSMASAFDAANDPSSEERRRYSVAGAIIGCAPSGRPIILQRTSESAHLYLRRYLQTDSVEMSSQLRAIREERRENRMHEVLLSVMHCTNSSEDAVRHLRELQKKSSDAHGWRINGALAMDIHEYMRKLREYEQSCLNTELARWVSNHRPVQQHQCGQIVSVPGCYGFSIGVVLDIVARIAIYRVQGMFGGVAAGNPVDVCFEDTSIPPAEFEARRQSQLLGSDL